MTQQANDRNGRSPPHQNEQVIPVERDHRRPGMAIVLGLMAATIASSFVAFDDLANPAYTVVSQVAFFVFLALFVAALIVRITRLAGRADRQGGNLRKQQDLDGPSR